MRLDEKKVAILATDGFEHSELFQPLDALIENGAEVDIISLNMGNIRSWDNDDWGESIQVNEVIELAKEESYDALVLPGGVASPDTLRSNESVKRFIRSFFEKEKPVAAICHAPWLLISAGVINNREVTSYYSIKDDVENAGATWLNAAVVVDDNLVTSRNPNDLIAFIDKTIEAILVKDHEEQVVEAAE